MIRKATEQDIPSIQSMAENVFRKTYAPILTPGQVDYMMEMMYSTESLRRQMTLQGHIFYIDEGRGYVSFRFDSHDGGVDVYHLEKLYVLPEAQSSGLGRALFETVLSHLAASGRSPFRIELNVNRNNPAVSFYRHMGLEISRQGDFPIGNGYYMNDYIMTYYEQVA